MSRAAVAVDTSVWIDFLGGRSTRTTDHLVALLDHARDVALTDVVLTEILQGLPEAQVASTEARLEVFDVLRLRSLADFRLAAGVYRAARRAGTTIRRTSDCLIAAVCIREGVPLLHDDHDFDRIAAVSDLAVIQP